MDHQEEHTTSFVVGNPFPGPVPQREGAIMELWEFGFSVVIQYSGLRPAELEAFQQGFKTYSYLESSTSVPIALRVFDFPNPHWHIDFVCDARVVHTEPIGPRCTPGRNDSDIATQLQRSPGLHREIYR